MNSFNNKNMWYARIYTREIQFELLYSIKFHSLKKNSKRINYIDYGYIIWNVNLLWKQALEKRIENYKSNSKWKH